MIFFVPVLNVVYQTWQTVFDNIPKHQEGSWKYDVEQTIFDKLQGLWKCGQLTVLSVWYIFSIETKSKEKTEK